MCVRFGDTITLTLPPKSIAAARSSVPTSVLIGTRPVASTQRIMRARVVMSDSLSAGDADFRPGNHAFLHSTCWNYGHWLYDTIIPLHRLTRSGHEATVHAVDVNSQECLTYHDSTFGLPYTFVNGTSLASNNATMCFSSLWAGFSPDWGLEAQYNPSLYSGPSLDQYQSFRDALFTDNTPKSNKRVIISKRAGPRRITNIEFISTELANRLGSEWTVQVLDFSALTIAEQIDAIRSSDAIVGLSGSNVLNAVFARDGFRVFEVLPVRMHDFHTNTFKRMPYLCHAVHRASEQETTFAEKNIAWINKTEFAQLYHADEDWRNPQSSRLWRSSPSVTLDFDRFWGATLASLTSLCDSTTYQLLHAHA